MTRQKSKTQKENAVPLKSEKQLDLRSQFKALDPKEQEAIINFFNLHNAAIWIFSSLSTPAVEYVNLSIKLSQENAKDEV